MDVLQTESTVSVHIQRRRSAAQLKWSKSRRHGSLQDEVCRSLSSLINNAGMPGSREVTRPAWQLGSPSHRHHYQAAAEANSKLAAACRRRRCRRLHGFRLGPSRVVIGSIVVTFQNNIALQQ